MRKYLIGLLIIPLIFNYLFSQGTPKFKYVGVSVCAPCHRGEKKGKMFEIWQASKHAKAYETLKSEESKKIAQQKGIKVPPHEAPECLKCHVTGYDAPKEAFLERFKIEEGVQCEACHGPGSEYKALKIMQSREESIKNGLILVLVADGSAEKQCRTCHNEESPTFKGFNFKEAWAQIAHPLPKQ
ncbi:MAG: cytochrome c family protein [Candidatus Kryptonium sp.]